MHIDVKKKPQIAIGPLSNSGDLKIETECQFQLTMDKLNNILKIAQLCSFQTYEKNWNIAKKPCHVFHTKLAFCLFS